MYKMIKKYININWSIIFQWAFHENNSLIMEYNFVEIYFKFILILSFNI